MNDQENISNQPGETTNTSQNSNRAIPVVEEQLHLDKSRIETGRVHISKKVTEDIFEADMPVAHDEVVVERKPVNRYIDGDAPGIRLDGNVTIIPVVKEVIVKRLLLVEEIHVTKRHIETTAPIREVLRKTDVQINRTSADDGNRAAGQL